MFLSKIAVAVASRGSLQNLTKLSKCLLSKQCTPADKEKCLKPDISTSVGAESRCEKHKESLGKCSRPQAKSDCQSGGASDSRTKDDCGRHAADSFSRTLAKVRNEALTLQIFTRNSVNAIIGSMDLENATRLKAERSRAIQRLQSAVDKIEQVTQMSLVCGAVKRNQCYAIHQQIFGNFQVWECENAANEQALKRRLEELEYTVKERTDTAVAVVRTCKGCASLDSLMICVEASANDADCILKMTDEHAKHEINSVQQAKTQILQESADIMQQRMSAFDQAVVQFEKELDTCIAELKKSQKR